MSATLTIRTSGNVARLDPTIILAAMSAAAIRMGWVVESTTVNGTPFNPNDLTDVEIAHAGGLLRALVEEWEHAAMLAATSGLHVASLAADRSLPIAGGPLAVSPNVARQLRDLAASYTAQPALSTACGCDFCAEVSAEFARISGFKFPPSILTMLLRVAEKSIMLEARVDHPSNEQAVSSAAAGMSDLYALAATVKQAKANIDRAGPPSNRPAKPVTFGPSGRPV